MVPDIVLQNGQHQSNSATPSPLTSSDSSAANSPITTECLQQQQQNQQQPFLPPPLNYSYPDQFTNQNLFAQQPVQIPRPLAYPQGNSFYNGNPYYGNNLYSNNNNNNSFNWRRNAAGPMYDPASHGIISRLAEERTRPTFRSIESVLEAFSSLNMILDSTYSAIHGSFKTITSVADHLIFVRNHLAEIALLPRALQAIARFLRWVLSALGLDGTKLADLLVTNGPERAWSEALTNGQASSEELKQLLAQSGNTGTGDGSSPLWPILVFFSLVLGTPYIIWRLLGAPGSIPSTNCPEWTLPRGRHFVAVAGHPFQARNSNELSFPKDAVLFIKPESLLPGSKFLIACLAPNQNRRVPRTNNNSCQIGLIPMSYVKLVTK